MKPRDLNNMRPMSGFSLIELMVSVVIGLLGIVVIFQVLSVWDARKRTTAAGSDAQVAGTIGMFALERDLKVAGYGLGRVLPTQLGCAVTARNKLGSNSNFALLPVQITQGTSGAPDQITVLYGSSSYSTGGDQFTASTAMSKRLRYRVGFFAGDLVVVADGTPTSTAANCALVEITGNSAADDRSVEHFNASYLPFGAPVGASSQPANFNATAGTGTTFTAGYMYNLGPNPRRAVWQIRPGGILTVSELFSASPAVDVAEGIVDLQAEYGFRNPATNLVEWTSTQPAQAGWTNLQAVRVAILARSQQFERDTVTTVAVPFFNGTRTFTMDNVFGAQSSNAVGSPTNWQNYRYRVYEKVIPFRNVIWGRVQAL
jgi:type IV pilus assembly protein PilW